MEWTVDGLRSAGFSRFINLLRADLAAVPDLRGVYVVVREATEPPAFLARTVAGPYKGRDLTVSVRTLKENWVAGASVINIGKAGGPTVQSTLRKRLRAYQRQGRGSSAGHAGGHYIWQLADHADLLVSWRPTPGEDPRTVEGAMIDEFRGAYGARPFANLSD